MSFLQRMLQCCLFIPKWRYCCLSNLDIRWALQAGDHVLEIGRTASELTLDVVLVIQTWKDVACIDEREKQASWSIARPPNHTHFITLARAVPAAPSQAA